MKFSLKKLAAVIVFVSANFYSQAQEKINVVTTAVPFLRISPDARAGGMGDAGIATLPDANSPFWNLAKTPFNTNPAGVSLTYTPWLKDLGLSDVYLASLAGYYKLDDLQAISTSLRYFSLGNIQFTDAFGNPLGSGRPREFAFDFGYSRKLTDQMGLGVALRYIRSNLATEGYSSGETYRPGTSIAGDISWYYNQDPETGEGWSFGAVLSNLGSKIGYTSDATQKDYIPANLGLGIGYTKIFDEANKINFALDVNKLMVPTPPFSDTQNPTAEDSAKLADYRSKSVPASWISSFGDAPGGFSEEIKELQFSLGAEYWYNDQFAFRVGYFFEDKTKGNRKYFTVGAGIKYNVINLNFSYLVPSGSGISRNPLSNTLRFGISFDLNSDY